MKFILDRRQIVRKSSYLVLIATLMLIALAYTMHDMNIFAQEKPDKVKEPIAISGVAHVFSSDGKQIYSVTNRGKFTVFNAANGKEKSSIQLGSGKFSGQNPKISSFMVHEKSKIVSLVKETGDRMGSTVARVYDMTTGKMLAYSARRNGRGMPSATVSPLGDKVILAGDSGTRLATLTRE